MAAQAICYNDASPIAISADATKPTPFLLRCAEPMGKMTTVKGQCYEGSTPHPRYGDDGDFVQD